MSLSEEPYSLGSMSGFGHSQVVDPADHAKEPESFTRRVGCFDEPKRPHNQGPLSWALEPDYAVGAAMITNILVPDP